MKLETILAILKYAGTVIAGIIAIMGTKNEKSDTTPHNPSGINPPGWKKWTLFFALLSLVVALASQIAEQIIDDQASATLTASLEGLQKQADLNQKNNSEHLDQILFCLTQIKAQSANSTNFISQTIQVFQQFTITLTNSPSPEIRQKANQIIDQIQNWTTNQPSATNPALGTNPMPDTNPTPGTKPTPGINPTPGTNPAPSINPTPGTNSTPMIDTNLTPPPGFRVIGATFQH